MAHIVVLMIDLLTVGLIYDGVITTIKLIRDFKRSRAVKSLNFTDEELDTIYDALVSDYEDLEIWYSEHGIDPDDGDEHVTLSSLETITDKILATGRLSRK